MAGLIIDVFIAYVIKITLRLRRSWGSGTWKLVKARIDSSWVDGGWVWNCPTAHVAYTYEFDGQTYSGIDTNPFLSDTLAEERIARFQSGEAAIVRVNPAQPQRSILKRTDQ